MVEPTAMTEAEAELLRQLRGVATMTPELDRGQLVQMSNGICPDCGHKGFRLGPRGGASINIECGGCRNRFNVVNIGWAIALGHRITGDIPREGDSGGMQAQPVVPWDERSELPIRALEWLWSFLPDRCQVVECSRHGVRGNENRVNGIVVCDYCHTRFWDYWKDGKAEPRPTVRPRPRP